VELKRALDYLQSISKPGSVVFTDDWDVFPACFYHNDYNYYCVGLDPMFTASKYPALWERYRLITRGKTPTALKDHHAESGERAVRLTDIGKYFCADYVLVMDDHRKLFRQLRKDSDHFAVIYPPKPWPGGVKQPEMVIFRVEPPGGQDST
jgi:hypothetical protein